MCDHLLLFTSIHCDVRPLTAVYHSVVTVDLLITCVLSTNCKVLHVLDGRSGHSIFDFACYGPVWTIALLEDAGSPSYK